MRAMLKTYPLLLVSLVSTFLCAASSAAPLLLGEAYDAHASSELADPHHTYAPSRLAAPSLETAWCEGAEGNGVGEWIELNLANPFVAKEGFVLEILPGYVKNNALYLSNGRPQELAIAINDTLLDAPIKLADESKIQSYRLNWSGKPVKSIRLKILSVYPGTQYQDTCITDIAIRQRLPQSDWNEAQANKEAHMLVSTFVDKDYRWPPTRINKNSLDFAMWLSEGMYYRGAEGGETLDGLYLDALINKPQMFFWVLSKQSDTVVTAVSKAIISPISDKYSDSQILDAIENGMKDLDVASSVRLKPLRDAYARKFSSP